MLTFQEAAHCPSTQVGQETLRLAALARELAPGFVLGTHFEEAFYRRANLPEQLSKLFSHLNPSRVDEDLLDVLCEQAATLVRTSALMDDTVQLFWRALNNAGVISSQKREFHMRRPGERFTESGVSRAPGHEVLFALKRLWAADWHFEAVLRRLDTAGGVGLEARPLLIFAGAPGQLESNPAAPGPPEAPAPQPQRQHNALGVVGLL